MKKLKRLSALLGLFIILTLGISGCSNDDGGEETLPKNLNSAIIGSWKWVREYGTEDGENWSENRSGREVWTFETNGTLIFIDRDGEINNTNWYITNDILTADDSDYKIEVLNEERMVISEGEEDWIEKREFLRITNEE